MTGLRRYTESLLGSLVPRGVDANLVYPQVPRVLASVGRVLAADARAFFSTYPLTVSLGGYDVSHLTDQTLATLLLFQHLPAAVVTVHDIIPHLVRRDPNLRTDRTAADGLFDRLALWALTRARALVAISRYTKQCLVQELGLSDERIHVVYRAVDHAAFRPLPVPDAFRRQYRLEEGKAHVLYVGSTDPRKNLAALVRAFALVQRQAPEARLLIAGASHFVAQRARLEKLITELALRESVLFLGQVPDADLPLLYNAADVFVLPSLYEGFGLPALEAMSCGTPVVASSRASLPEVVGTGGTLVDPLDEQALAEAIAVLLADQDLRTHASRAALEQASLFSLERQAEETLAVYQEVRQSA